VHLVAHPIATGILKRRLGTRKVSKGQLFEEMRPKAKPCMRASPSLVTRIRVLESKECKH